MATAKKNARTSSRKGGTSAKKKAQTPGATQEIVGFALMVAGIFSFVAVVMGGAGLLGEGVAGVMFGLFGLGAYIVPLLLVCIGWVVLIAKRLRLHPGKLALTSATVLMLFVINHLIVDGSIQKSVLETKESVGYWSYVVGSYAYGQAHHVGSGALGGVLTFPMRALLGTVGCWILTIALIVGCVFVLGKLSMRSTAQKVSEAAVGAGRRVRETARTHSQERALRQEMRRAEQMRMDLDAPQPAAAPEHERPELRNERVTGPARRDEPEPRMTPLTREEPEVEEGEIYDAPRKTLPRFELFSRKKSEPEDDGAIEIDHDDPSAGEAPVSDEEEIVPVEIVPVIQPVRVEDAEPDPAVDGPETPEPPKPEARPADSAAGVRFDPIVHNPSVSDFDDDPEDDAIIEPPHELPNLVLGKPREISPAKEVEYQYAEESTPVIDPKAVPPYRFPPLTLLTPAKTPDPVRDHEQEEEQQKKIELLEETLLSFGIEARVVNVARGPAITRYELQPARGVKVSKITGLADDIALNMAAMGGVRIEAPVPGKSAVGIEIANATIATVPLREVLESKEFQEHPSKIAVALGKDIAGTPVVADLARMPHLLIAGATGSGKSVCINSIIASILYKATPDEVRLILIDPKVVELSVYNGIPHLLIPVVSDPKKAAGALGWAVQEMTDRYKKFEGAVVRDLKGYNKYAVKNGIEPLPQIVVIIDELADLMMVAQGDVEQKICRLTQLARAAGIHLVIATQRPSVDVITGLIKANVPSRIAFAVASQVDSRTILGIGGAEKLLGRGDMLFDPSGASKAIRVQGAFISDDEVTDLVDFVKDKAAVRYDESVIEALDRADAADKKQKDEEKEEEDTDPLLMDCVELAVDAGQISASMIQRKHRVGYARAGRILDQMEKRGYISGFEGSKPRQTRITREQFYQLAGIEPDAPAYHDDEE
ncbi:MAG: DNA translocase FtsK [Candidatus Spyradocola sp.]|jgi:S-DNA-T family DNA segregation ATPase FtsK/SpoIIIE